MFATNHASIFCTSFPSPEDFATPKGDFDKQKRLGRCQDQQLSSIDKPTRRPTSSSISTQV